MVKLLCYSVAVHVFSYCKGDTADSCGNSRRTCSIGQTKPIAQSVGLSWWPEYQSLMYTKEHVKKENTDIHT